MQQHNNFKDKYYIQEHLLSLYSLMVFFFFFNIGVTVTILHLNFDYKKIYVFLKSWNEKK